MKKLYKVLVSTLFIATFGFATTINVPADSTTIQGGINGASTGDTVLVAAGTYMENIIFPGTNIVVMSSQGADSTIIDGNQNGSVVTIYNDEDTTTVLSGFTITNGNSNNGGGIRCNSNPILKNLIIRYNSATSGGGIYCTSNPTLENLVIRYNSAIWGGGVYCGSWGNTVLKNVIISNNTANGGGGIWGAGNSLYDSGPTLINVVITSNSGYGLDIVHSNTIIENTIIYYNGSGSILPANTNSLNVSYSDIEGGHSGTGNINEPPLFCDITEADLSLAANSPCIGTGENGTNMGNLEIGCDSIFTSLLINEIMQNPYAVSDENGEWFEIYNDGEAPINLEGWIIADKDDDTTVIAESYLSHPGSYSIIGIDANESVNGGVNVDIEISEFSLGNGSDEIILLNPSGIMVDSVGWDNGSTFPDPTGASMALLSPELDNSVGSNWAESTLPYGDGDFGTPELPNFLSDITLSLTSLDFDTVNVNESEALSLNISNVGNVPLILDSLYTNTTLFILSLTDSIIETSELLQVTFTPTEYGPVTDTLHILSNDPDESMVEIPLSGFGYYSSPDIELESTSLNFGSVMDGLTGVELFEVYNIGETALEIDTIYCIGNFSVMPSNGTLNEGDTLALEVSFSPNDETSFTGTMTIVAGNDPDEDTLTVGLSGNGTQQAPIMELSNDSLYFGVVMAGDTITRQTTIYNMGMLNLEVEEITMVGSEYFTTTFSDATVEPSDSVEVVFQFAPTEQVSEATSTATIVASGVNNQTVTLWTGWFPLVWHVATTGSDSTGDGSIDNPFATIQTAIDTAGEGDTVLVSAGTYFENLIWPNTNGIKLIGIGDTTNTIIDGSNADASVIFMYPSSDTLIDTTTLIDNFRIINGSGTPMFGFGPVGGGLLIREAGPSLKNLYIAENTAVTGAAMMIVGSNSVLDGIIITNNVIYSGNEYGWNGHLNDIQQCSLQLNNIKIINNAGLGVSNPRNGFQFINNEYLEFSNIFISENHELHGLTIAYYNDSDADVSLINVEIENNYSGLSLDWRDSHLLENISIHDNDSIGLSLNFMTLADSTAELENLALYNNNPNLRIYMGYEALSSTVSHLTSVNGDINSYQAEWHQLTIINSIIDLNTDHNINFGEVGANVDATIQYSLITTGWEGEGNIDGDPLFCNPDSGDFTLAENSPCVGTGENGVNMGAFGVGCDSIMVDPPSSIENEIIPQQYTLHQNYPNPFNPITTLRYDLPEQSMVNIIIYDIMGREVKSLINQTQDAGFKSVIWNATNDYGKPVSAGVYLYQIQAGEYMQTKKMVLLK